MKVMKVVKRDGRLEDVQFDKIFRRIQKLSKGLNNVDVISVSKSVVSGLFDKVTTRQLDQLAMRTASNLSTFHTDYDQLAARLAVNNLHKETSADFAETMEILYSRVDDKGQPKPFLNDDFMKIVRKHKKAINAEIVHKRDYDFDFLGIATLIHRYLSKDSSGQVVERPQHMWMRVALGIHGNDIAAAFDTYEKMSKKMMTHATPTLFNAGTTREQMSSCFLLSIDQDSIIGDNYDKGESAKGIFKTINDCAALSKLAGGIGVHIHKIRSAGTPIYGTGGISDGIVPMVKMFDSTAWYVNQGGRRKGSFAMYLTVTHPDIYDFLDLKRNTGKDEIRARNLFYAVWVPDLFMERVRKDEDWTLMDPMLCPGLDDLYGEEFKELYERYEREGKGSRTVKAQHLYRKIIEIQIETSMPYMIYKDHINNKSNQKNVGTIQSSNLCAEIAIVSNSEEVGTCNLASVALPAFVEGKTRVRFNHKKLHEVVKQAVRNLNKVIDVNYYPIKESQTSNMRHRPIGLGVQGLADTFLKMRINWDTPEAFKLNQEIFETMYHAALESSLELAKEKGPYSTFEGSPSSQGILQYDMWFESMKKNWEDLEGRTFFDWKNPHKCATAEEYYCSKRYDWLGLKEEIKTHGLRNSLLLALMPTASTASILGNTEGFEPVPGAFYKRHVLSGEFIRSNKFLVKELQDLGIWDDLMRQRIIADDGSIQRISKIPEETRKLFRTVWEIPQKALMELSAARGAFICQTQSFNIYMKKPTIRALSSAHAHSHRLSMKTGMYYLRSLSAGSAQKFTIDVKVENEVLNEKTRFKKAKEALLEKGFSEEDMKHWSREQIIEAGGQKEEEEGDEECLMCSG